MMIVICLSTALKHFLFNCVSSFLFHLDVERSSNKNEDIQCRDHLIIPVFSFVFSREDLSTVGGIYSCTKSLELGIPY